MKKILFVLTILFSTQVSATHIIGGYIRIKSMSGLTVTFEFVGYRDTDSPIQFGSGIFDFGDGNRSDGIFNNSNSSTIDLGNRVQVFIGELTHTYTAPGRYVATYQEDNRTPVVNMEASINTPFYTQSSFVIDPVFQNHFPNVDVTGMFSADQNQVFKQSPVVNDEDGDLIVFRLVKPLQGRDYPVENYDFVGAEIDKYTGNMTWDPTGLVVSAGVEPLYCFAIEVTEYRKANNSWIKLNKFRIDFNIELQDINGDVSDLAIDGQACGGGQVSVSYSNQVSSVLEADLPFLDLQGGAISELDSVNLKADTTFLFEVKSSAKPFDYGHVSLCAGDQCQSYNLFYSQSCDREMLNNIITAAPPITKDFTVYPNPTSGAFTVSGLSNDVSVVRVVSMTGQLMAHYERSSSSKSMECEADIKPGFYLIQLLNESGSFLGTRKLVVTN